MSTEKKLQQIIDLMQGDDSVDAPGKSIRWASNLYRQRASEPKKSLVQKIAAVLQMEIAPNKPAFGERSASASQVRQLLFNAGDNAVDIRIEPKARGFGLRGQLLGGGLADAVITLFNDANVYDSRATELGEFAFENINAGEYELKVRGETVEITLKSIAIG